MHMSRQVAPPHVRALTTARDGHMACTLRAAMAGRVMGVKQGPQKSYSAQGAAGLTRPGEAMRFRALGLTLGVVLGAPACVVRAPGLDSGPRSTAFGASTEPSMPPGQASEEATDDQLALARNEGNAVDAAVDYLISREAYSGARVRAGDYRIAVALTPLVGAAAGAQACHLAVIVADGYDGRVVPELAVRATVFDTKGHVLAEQPLPFVWHPLVHHYGADVSLGAAGPYRVQVSVAPARMRRHDPTNGDRYEQPTVAEVGWLGLGNEVPRVDHRQRQSLAVAQGSAYRRALATMSDGVAVDGASKRVGDYVVAYAVEFAEGYWYLANGKLRYYERTDESSETNAHVEVAVLDAETGRFMPGLSVTATLYKNGERVDTLPEPFMWHPWVYHYGANWRVPGAGRYSLEVAFERPPYAEGTLRFPTGGHVRFEAVDLAVGQK